MLKTGYGPGHREKDAHGGSSIVGAEESSRTRPRPGGGGRLVGVRLIDREAGEHESVDCGYHADHRRAEAAEQRWRLVLSEPSTPVSRTVRRHPVAPVSPPAAGFGRVA